MVQKSCDYRYSPTRGDNTLDLVLSTMKNNLIFTNLADQPTEDVEIKLRASILEKLSSEE
jgi:hypothetical protein